MSATIATQEESSDERSQPRTSTPLHAHNTDETIPDFGASTEFEDAPLQDYDGPISDDAVNTAVPVIRTSLTAPTLRPLSKIGSNPQILARRTEALAKGATGTGKDFLMVASKASRRLFQHIFPKELELLETLLTQVEQVELLSKYPAYRVERDNFRLLLRVLRKLRAQAEDSFRIEGKTLPPLPTWGDDEDISEVYDPNAFEILGVCFRVEVESFLVLLDRYFNYNEQRPQDRHTDLDEAAEQLMKMSRTPSLGPRSEQFSTSFPEYDQQPRNPSVSESTAYPLRNVSVPRVGPALTNSGLPRNNQRMGEILNPMAPSFQPMNQRMANSVPTRPEESDQLRRMTPQGSLRPRDLPPHMSQGNPTGRTSGTRPPAPFRQGGAPPAGDPDDGDDDDDDDDDYRGYAGRRRAAPYRLPGDKKSAAKNLPSNNDSNSAKVAQFDFKLKFDAVPKWDGNVDTIIRWMLKVNDIARESQLVFQQLGRVVPKRLEGAAEIWYWSLPIKYRSEIEQNWDTLRQAFSTYFLNRKWLDSQRGRANRASYRDSGHSRETPSEYFIRKTELLNTVYTMDDSEIILEVMEGAPSTWNTILTTQMYRDIVEFQAAICYHEDALMKLDRQERDYGYRDRNRDRERDRDYSRNNTRMAQVNLVGWSANLEPPKFPKDDRNVSKRATPESKGARPCRHCGSGKHWDNECKHSFRGNREARANLANSNSEDLEAQGSYDDLYYALDSEEESETELVV
ncbi:hypothetical protein C8R45DRAFT_1111727 [Mycena sanguinolenta]|nr:hypothetical protein C8R45DRAFT_1111727 [Mycena sanguinolenta]